METADQFGLKSVGGVRRNQVDLRGLHRTLTPVVVLEFLKLVHLFEDLHFLVPLSNRAAAS
jgi:hypothetical protein